jgi:hypothetical protein
MGPKIYAVKIGTAAIIAGADADFCTFSLPGQRRRRLLLFLQGKLVAPGGARERERFLFLNRKCAARCARSILQGVGRAAERRGQGPPFGL